nr:TetR/AcrR family transcriptional regulator [Mesorhizobium loti]
MARVKNETVRQAILTSAASQIAMTSYMDTTVAKIAKGAGIAPSNVYVYFESKLQIYFTIYTPWFETQVLALERAVARLKTPERKIQRLVSGLLNDIADDKTGYTSALMEGLAIVMPKDKYKPDLLHWAENKIVQIVCDALEGYTPQDPRLRAFAHLLMLTFDGVAMRVKSQRAANESTTSTADVEEALVGMLIAR